jgi:glycosyltransferase involved in cell wall biosynthesis
MAVKTKICYIISNLNIGGAELTLKKITIGLSDDFDFTIISFTGIGSIGNSLKNQGINVISLNIANILQLLPKLIQLYKYLKFLKPDIVHTWMYHSDFLGGLISKIAGIKTVYWNIRNTEIIDGTSISTKFIAVLNIFLSYLIPSKIVLVSESSKIYHSKIGFCKSKMIVIPNGYDLDLYNFNNEIRMKLRQKLFINDSTIVIGSVGRYNKYKDQYTFIKSALYILDNLNENLDIKFIIIGKDITINNEEISSLIINSKHLNKFILLTNKKDIINYYFIFDIFCLHSISEGFPNVLAEAMATGLPCISTNVGDSKLILKNDRFIVRPKDINNIAKKLIELILLDTTERKLIGEYNKSTISFNYSINNLLNNYKLIYKINQ